MSELQSIRIDSITGGLNTLDSKNSMPPNQGIVCRNWMPYSNGSVGPRRGSTSFDNGALAVVSGTTLGMFQAFLSNGGRRLLFFTHTDATNALGGGANVNYTFMREYDPNPAASGWRGSHQIVFSDSTLGGQYQSFAQMQDRVYRTDISRGVRRTEFTHQGVATGGTNLTAVQPPTAMSPNNAIWNNAGYMNNVPAGYSIQRRLWHTKDASANLRTDIAVTTGFTAATGTVTVGTNFPTAVIANDQFDVVSDLPGGLRVPVAADLAAGLAPAGAATPGPPAGRMVFQQQAAAAFVNYAYLLVPSSLQLGDHQPVRPLVGKFDNYAAAVRLVVGLAAGGPATFTNYAVTFPGADLEIVAREAGLSPKLTNGDTIKIYRSLNNPGGVTAGATAGQTPQDDDAWRAVPFYYVGSYTVGSIAAFVDMKNDNELVDQYGDPVLFSTPEEFAQHKFAYMCAHKGRMFYGYEVYNVTGGSNFTRGSRLYWSDIGHPDRVVGYVDVGANDAGDITALWSFNGALFIGKQDKVYLLTGSSPSSFDLRLAIPHLGVLCPRTIAAMGNELVWLSQNGFIAFDGSTVREVSQHIKPDVDVMLKQLGVAYTGVVTAVAEIDRYWFFFPFVSATIGGYGFLYDTRHTEGTWWKVNLDAPDTAGVPISSGGTEGHIGIALNRTTHGGQLLIGSKTTGRIYDWQNAAATLDGGAAAPALEWVSPNMDAGAPELVKQWRHIAIDVEKVDTGDTLTLYWYVDSDHPDVTSGYTASGSFTIDTSTLPQTMKFSLPQAAFGRRLMLRLYSTRQSAHTLGVPVIAGIVVHYRLKRGARNREETR